MPTVIRLTSKLQGTPESDEMGLCPLCLGVKDEIKNLLEIGSPIIKIENNGQNVVRITSSDEWFVSSLEKQFCFGCKRLCIEAKNKS